MTTPAVKLSQPSEAGKENVSPVSDVFREHYEGPRSQWGHGSGPGSSAFHTIEYQAFLSKFIYLNNIKTVTDIGCGDWQFSRFINFTNTHYLGLDVVDSVIQRNKALHGTDVVQFRLMPKDLTAIMPTDLLLMKDVLQHLPDAEIVRICRNVVPNFKFSLITNSFQKLDTSSNIDVEAGSFRCLDLAAPPYSMRGAYVLEFGTAVWERVRVFLHQTR